MEAPTLQRRLRASAEERMQGIAQYRSSQLSAAQFAQQHGLKVGTLQRWMREERQHRKAATETPGFEEVHLPGFGPAGAWWAEVALPSGIVMRLAAAAPRAWLQSLWESLR